MVPAGLHDVMELLRVLACMAALRKFANGCNVFRVSTASNASIGAAAAGAPAACRQHQRHALGYKVPVQARLRQGGRLICGRLGQLLRIAPSACISNHSQARRGPQTHLADSAAWCHLHADGRDQRVVLGACAHCDDRHHRQDPRRRQPAGAASWVTQSPSATGTPVARTQLENRSHDRPAAGLWQCGPSEAPAAETHPLLSWCQCHKTFSKAE